MKTMTSTFLKEWRISQAFSVEDLALRSGVSASLISAMETGSPDYTGGQLIAVAESLGCEPWRILAGPPCPAEFRTKLVAQMLRDICVEAVTTYEDMSHLDDLRENVDAEDFWLQVAAHFESALDTMCRASSTDPFALSKK